MAKYTHMQPLVGVQEISDALIGSRCNDHKPVSLTLLHTVVHLGKRRKKERLFIGACDVVGLFTFRVSWIGYPFKPSIRRRQSPAAWAQAFEKIPCHHRLGPSIDRSWTLPLRPKWRPSSLQAINVQAIPSLENDFDSRRRGNVD